jgi:hypothetical protein
MRLCCLNIDVELPIVDAGWLPVIWRLLQLLLLLLLLLLLQQLLMLLLRLRRRRGPRTAEGLCAGRRRREIILASWHTKGHLLLPQVVGGRRRPIGCSEARLLLIRAIAQCVLVAKVVLV